MPRLYLGPGLAEIGLCTSTRWSPGTWQLLLMFHLDRVNRLPEQTQRRVYGCAAPAQRRGGGGGAKNFSLGGEPQQKFEHSYIPRLSLHVRSFESTGNYPSGVPPPSYEYYIYRTAQQLHIYANNPRPKRSRGPLF